MFLFQILPHVQTIHGIDITRKSGLIGIWEHFIGALVTCLIYIDIDPVATNFTSVIFTDFDDQFKKIVEEAIEKLRDDKCTELSPKKIFNDCYSSLHILFSKNPCDSVTPSIPTIFNLLSSGRNHKNYIIKPTDCSEMTSVYNLFISHLPTDTKRIEFQLLAPPVVIFYFDLIPQNEIEVKQKMTFEPELLLNLKSIVYELISIIYVSHKKNYLVSFCNDGRNYLYHTLNSDARCKRMSRPIYFPLLETHNSIHYHPTLLFYQQKYRVRK